MEQTLLSPAKPAKLFARELEDGQQVETVFLVKEASRRQKRNGEPFLKLQLADVTGSLDAVCWDGVEPVEEAARPGTAVMVCGRYSLDERYGATLTLRGLRPADPDEYLAADLHDAPPIPIEQMEADLRELVATIQDPALRELLDSLLADGSEVWARWREWPAAKTYHHAYRHGLLEHCLSVAQGVSALAATFPGLDRDVAVAGALLHDIGKIEAYSMEDGVLELSDAGKLQGEIALGYFIVRSAIERIPAFPHATAEALLHIVLSHHGSLQHGSPVVPCTRESTLVHMIDNLGGRLGSFDRLEKSLQDGQRWSRFDRALDGSAYFGPAAAGERQAA